MTRRSALVFALLLVAVVASAEKHPFNVHDLVAMQRVGDPRPSPDGSRVAFVVTTMDLEANTGRRDIWIAATDGSGAHRLTSDPANDWGPRWGGDGTLYFLSSRSDTAQVWRWNFAAGAAEQVTDLPLDVGELAAGPRGEALYLGLAVFPDCDDSIPCTGRPGLGSDIRQSLRPPLGHLEGWTAQPHLPRSARRGRFGRNPG